MKKILLIVLLLGAGSLLFAAQIDRSTFPPTLSVTANAGWGIDLTTGATGLTNSISTQLLLPLLGTQSFQTVPSDVYGKIEIDDLDLHIGLGSDGSATTVFTNTAITAEIVFKPFYVSIFNVPSVDSYFQGSPVATGVTTGVVRGSSDASYHYGIEWGVKNETAPDLPYQFAAALLSYSDTGDTSGYTTNTANKYMVAGNFQGNIVPELLDIKTSLLVRPSTNLGWNGVDTYYELNLPINFDVLYGFQIQPGIDIEISPYNSDIPWQFSTGAQFTLYLSAPNVTSKAQSTVQAVVSYGADKLLSASASFSEPDEGGFIDDFGGSITASGLNLNTPNPVYSLNATIEDQIRFDGYNTLTPQFVYKVDYPANQVKQYLTPNINFTNQNSIPNTKFSFIYIAGDLLSRWNSLTKWNPGTITVTATVSF